MARTTVLTNFLIHVLSVLNLFAEDPCSISFLWALHSIVDHIFSRELAGGDPNIDSFSIKEVERRFCGMRFTSDEIFQDSYFSSIWEFFYGNISDIPNSDSVSLPDAGKNRTGGRFMAKTHVP